MRLISHGLPRKTRGFSAHLMLKQVPCHREKHVFSLPAHENVTYFGGAIASRPDVHKYVAQMCDFLFTNVTLVIKCYQYKKIPRCDMSSNRNTVKKAAIPSGSFFTAQYKHRLNDAFGHLIKGEEFDHSFMRPAIYESWLRSYAAVGAPGNEKARVLPEEKLTPLLEKNSLLISIVHPYMEKLYSVVRGSGSYILLCDHDGYILDMLGDPDIVSEGQEYSSLTAGANRNENTVGTNGIGTCIYLERPIQIWSAEHYLPRHKKYTCSSAPFFAPDGKCLGCLDITLLEERVHPHTLGMVISAADAITQELRLREASHEIEEISDQRNSIIQSIPAGVMLLNEDNVIVQTNETALHMLRVKSDVIGRDFFSVFDIDGNQTRNGRYVILSKQIYNREVNISLAGEYDPPRKYNVSVNFVMNRHGKRTGTVLDFSEPKLLKKLVNKISGYKSKYTFDSIVGISPSVRTFISMGQRAAQSDSNVLILGESGTGKEIMAQAIHNASSYSKGPFVAINCAALPKSLVESELFGYEKGAFTGANKDGNPGKFELAEGGTIFLDEIGDMPLDVQATLLRVLQNREVVRIGGKYPIPINVRVIAATNKNLEDAIAEKTFRADLYYRINVLNIYTPPLRERGSDIMILADYFVNQFNEAKDRNIKISPDVYPILLRYDWPGNVRELENVIERALNITDSGVIYPEHISISGKVAAAYQPAPSAAVPETPVVNGAAITMPRVYEYAQSAPQTIPSGLRAPAPSAPVSAPAASERANYAAQSAAAQIPAAPTAAAQAPAPTAQTPAGSGVFPHDVAGFSPAAGGENRPSSPMLTIEEQNKQACIDALTRSGGNISKASRLLGINRRTLYRKMEKYGIEDVWR